MDSGFYELVNKILWAVSFIAIGGAVAMIFFVVFGQSILGLKMLHKQFEKLLRQTEQVNEQLKQITEHLKKDKTKK